MKLTIRRYCNEGHDILSAKDMRKALLEHPVSGVTASVNKVDVSKMSAEVKPMKDFNSFHNFESEKHMVSGKENSFPSQILLSKSKNRQTLRKMDFLSLI